MALHTSFSEMMGLPNSQLDTTYWLPWYNNVDLDTQLRFGNVSGSTATVHVYIGRAGDDRQSLHSCPRPEHTAELRGDQQRSGKSRKRYADRGRGAGDLQGQWHTYQFLGDDGAAQQPA